ncbi:hypothetical protein GOP47_0018825 [Adiantum capillus-veneris]|uniref:RRM domain-containing protein n=1 Tax=Adiantum capillus-veneris TaxID=13818 RepID=A0A9D4UDZ3_ADICA|nr:hypothetical protein GOP47_0018825 [Adiantum capillus-veneris]
MTSLDMALDEIIEMNKQQAEVGGGRGRARGRRGRGGLRRGLYRGALRVRRPMQFQLPKSFLRRGSVDNGWRRDVLEDIVGPSVRSVGIETGTKLYLSNLDYGVSNEDIKELFSEVGDLRRCGIHYDRSGRSKGTAEVVYARRQDAVIALKRYNNVLLDGKPLKIELIGTNLIPSLARGRGPSTFGRGQRMVVMSGGVNRGRGRGGGTGRGRGFGSRRFRGQGRGRGRRVTASTDRKPPTAEQLNADLDKYHQEAMQTS